MIAVVTNLKRMTLFATLLFTLFAVGWITEKALNRHDSSILSELNAQLATDERFGNIQMDVTNRVVSLKGVVKLFEDKRFLLNKANGIRHVRMVKDEVVVDTVWTSDRSLRRQIYEKLQAERFNEIGLKVKKGTVTLRGYVPTKVHRERIVSIVSSTDGVREVVDKIAVRPARHPGESQ